LSSLDGEVEPAARVGTNTVYRLELDHIRRRVCAPCLKQYLYPNLILPLYQAADLVSGNVGKGVAYPDAYHPGDSKYDSE